MVWYVLLGNLVFGMNMKEFYCWDSLAPGTDFSSTYDSEDTSWEIGITRIEEIACHTGCGRELSNYFDIKVSENDFKLKSKIENVLKTNSGKISECNSYVSIEIENFNITDSPFYIRYRLSQVGTRIINNVVDLTNYVLYDIGQQIHAFDEIKYLEQCLLEKQKTMKNINSR